MRFVTSDIRQEESAKNEGLKTVFFGWVFLQKTLLDELIAILKATDYISIHEV
jgi:hypothetical protein